MKLVEQHNIDRQDARFAVIDPACFASKNLYNASLYILRQAFFHHDHVPSYAQLAHTLKGTPEFRALPAKVAQWVVRQVCADWDTFWKAHAAYQKCPPKFTGRPKLPHYKPKQDGRNLLVYTRQAIGRPPSPNQVGDFLARVYAATYPGELYVGSEEKEREFATSLMEFVQSGREASPLTEEHALQ